MLMRISPFKRENLTVQEREVIFTEEKPLGRGEGAVLPPRSVRSSWQLHLLWSSAGHLLHVPSSGSLIQDRAERCGKDASLGIPYWSQDPGCGNLLHGSLPDFPGPHTQQLGQTYLPRIFQRSKNFMSALSQ